MPDPLGLTRGQFAECWAEFKEYFEDDEDEVRSRPLRQVLKRFLESVMLAQLEEQIGARRYERGEGRRGYRNGYYTRGLLTGFGLIPSLLVPRPRQGRLATNVFRRYRRRYRVVENFIRQVFLAGASTRDTAELLAELFGQRLSPSTVSEINRVLDEEVARFHRRQLDDDWLFLILDGVWVKVSGYRVVNKVVLVVYGIRPDGRREVVDFALASSESEAEWRRLLLSIYRRGLRGERLVLVTGDGGKGVMAALSEVYPQAVFQRCWVHKMRNLIRLLPAGCRAACLRELKAVYLAANYRSARQCARRWAEKWRGVVPRAVAVLEKDLESLLVHMQRLPEQPAIWVRIRTTNAIERLFRELRKRTRPMCAFTNNASCERIVYALFNTCNQKWRHKRLWTNTKFTQNS